MKVLHETTVRFADVDRAGVAFFAMVFPLCHAAWEDVVAQVVAPMGIDESFRADRWPLPVVRAEADFRRPMRLGERLVVAPRLDAVGARSLVVAYDICGVADGVLRAEARLTHAWVDTASGKSRPIEPAFRAGLVAVLGEPRNRVGDRSVE